MKKMTMVFMASSIALGLLSCKKEINGEGPLVTESRSISGFTGIDLRIPGDVYYTNDPSWKVELVTQKNIADIIQTSVVDGKLSIGFDAAHDFIDADHIRINISAPAANSFSLHTAGSIYCMNTIRTDKLTLRIAGSGNMFLHEVIADNMEAVNNGSGDLKVAEGTVANENLTSSGSGDILVSAVSAASVTAKTSGSGSIRVKATGHLHATINGSGSIYYVGYPAVSSHVSGTGHLVHF